MSVRRRFVILSCAVVGLAAVIGPAGAQAVDGRGAPARSVAAQVASPPTTAPPPTTSRPRAASIEEQLRDAYDDAVAEEREALDVYKVSLEKTQYLDERIVALDAELVRVTAELESARTRLAAAQVELGLGEQRLREVQAELVVEKGSLNRKAVSAYVGGDSRQAQLEMVLGASELRELESSQAYSAAIVDDQLDSVQRVKRLEAGVLVLRDRLATQERTIRGARDTIATEEANLAKARTEVGELREAQAAETERQKVLLAQIRAKKQGYLDRIRALERESDGIASVLRAAQAAQQPVLDIPTLRTPLDRPLRLESPFGMRVHPIFQELRMHAGADLDGATGDPVRTSRAGVVMLAGTQDGYGGVVVVDHGDQIATVYAHLSVVGVRFGDVLQLGDVVGRVGSTGYSTGPHLHFELRVSGAPVDPMPHVDARSCEALFASTTPADLALLANRTECVRPATPAPALAPASSAPPPTR